MNKTTLENLKKYVKRNASKFDYTDEPESHQCSYRYKELKIGYAQDWNNKLIYYIIICEQYIDNDQRFIEELFDMIEQRQEKIKKDKQIQSYNNFIKKINRE
jgi:hypothetical protein